MKEDLRKEYHDAHEIAKAGWNNFNVEARANMEFYLGAQHDKEEADKADRQRRQLYVINKVKRQVNLIHGFEIRNRHILKIGPIGGEDDVACRQHTGIIMYLMMANNLTGYDLLSNSFKWGSLVSGSNLMEIWRDREGNLQFYRHGYNGFLVDPGLTKSDLSDCDNVFIGRWLSRDRIKMLLPQSADSIDKITPLRYSERWEYLGQPPLGNKENKRLYEEWWRREFDYEETVLNRISGKEIPFKQFVNGIGDERRARYAINEIKLQNGIPALVKYSKPKPWIRLTILVDDQYVWDGPNPLYSDDYNFVWLHGEFVPECPRDGLKLQPFSSILRDPQKARNRRICQALDIIESQIQTGRLIRSKYIKNIDDVYKSGQGVPIHIGNDIPDDMPMESVFKQIEGVDVKPGLFQIMELLDRDETDVGGLNEEIFGSDDKEIPGILHRYRTGNALTGQQGIFQGFRSSKRELGRKLVRLIQLNYHPEKVKRIINELPVREFYVPDFSRFDCTPTEGVMTDTQQHLFYLELKSLRAMFPDIAQMIPASTLVESMPIQFKKELLEVIKRAEQRAQQNMEAQLADKKRMDRMIEAETAENIAEAQENRANALYDRVRTMTEIQKLRDEPFWKTIDKLLELEKIDKQKKLPAKQ